MNKGVWSYRIFICSKLLVVEEIFATCVVIHWLLCTHSWVFNVALVVSHDRRHKFEERVTNPNNVDLAVFFIRVDQYPHKCIVNHFKVRVRALCHGACSFH